MKYTPSPTFVTQLHTMCSQPISPRAVWITSVLRASLGLCFVVGILLVTQTSVVQALSQKVELFKKTVSGLFIDTTPSTYTAAHTIIEQATITTEAKQIVEAYTQEITAFISFIAQTQSIESIAIENDRLLPFHIITAFDTQKHIIAKGILYKTKTEIETQQQEICEYLKEQRTTTVSQNSIQYTYPTIGMRYAVPVEFEEQELFCTSYEQYMKELSFVVGASYENKQGEIILVEGSYALLNSQTSALIAEQYETMSASFDTQKEDTLTDEDSAYLSHSYTYREDPWQYTMTLYAKQPFEHIENIVAPSQKDTTFFSHADRDILAQFTNVPLVLEWDGTSWGYAYTRDRQTGLSFAEATQKKQEAKQQASTQQHILYQWPTPKTHTVTQQFHAHHKALDLAGAQYDPVVAIADGVVRIAQCGYNSGYGCLMIIDHQEGVSSLYAHMTNIMYRAGDTVIQGDIIGLLGTTGLSTGPHLHMELWDNTGYLDPEQLLTNQ